jgi:hypothetical protein
MVHQSRYSAQQMDTVTDTTTAFGRWAIDELLERYISWREECCAVRVGYQRWANSGPRERGLAYAGYVVALDREERAAQTYAAHVQRISPIARTAAGR